jgi:acetyltransferase-like isoleucine patch superfamily enzyme
LRYLIASALAERCGQNVFFGPDVEILGWEKLRLGSNISIQRWCYLDATGGIDIGNEVSIAHGVSMLSLDHSWTDSTRPIRDQPNVLEPVTIQDDVWIGAGVRILRGVVVRRRTIVAAGAVVTKGTTGNEIVGGIPARSLKALTVG